MTLEVDTVLTFRQQARTFFRGMAHLMDFTGSLKPPLPPDVTVADDMNAAWKDIRDVLPDGPDDLDQFIEESLKNDPEFRAAWAKVQARDQRR